MATTVSMVELRRNTARVLQSLRQGHRLLLTYRGEAIARIEPVAERPVSPDDPIYRLADLAADEGAPITNDEIDEIVYGR